MFDVLHSSVVIGGSELSPTPANQESLNPRVLPQLPWRSVRLACTTQQLRAVGAVRPPSVAEFQRQVRWRGRRTVGAARSSARGAAAAALAG